MGVSDLGYDPDIHNRRSIRLRGFDYSSNDAYFVTICTQARTCFFGNVIGIGMQLNDAGRMVHAVWAELPTHYPGVEIGPFVVMPNHVRGIVILVGAGPRACPLNAAGQPQGVAPTMTLGDVVHRFKSFTTRRYADGVRNAGLHPFDRRLWQRNYYEHIIRDADSYERIYNYIVTNPHNWSNDFDNPEVSILDRDSFADELLKYLRSQRM